MPLHRASRFSTDPASGLDDLPAEKNTKRPVARPGISWEQDMRPVSTSCWSLAMAALKETSSNMCDAPVRAAFANLAMRGQWICGPMSVEGKPPSLKLPCSVHAVVDLGTTRPVFDLAKTSWGFNLYSKPAL